ncbi:Gfo/Idh/MocA family oxidoreductase [Deinococcus sonorensis]|uniref:Gfo/Idh/MocA family oxidoreductase n=2 Tax=Deinococcus sonorensis TaxID=309891 RepID=A0AAU7UAX6_9DEIO
MTRLGLVGAGYMAHTHAAALRSLGAEVVGVCATDAAAAERLAQQHQLQLYRTLDELLEAVDVVDLCTPTDTHEALTVRAARAGRHVICEKPIALSPESGERMIAACEAAGVRLFIALVLRFFPQYRAAHEQVAAGAIGRPELLRLMRTTAPPAFGGDWYFDPERSGGALLDLLIHDLDYARWVAGDVRQVYALTRQQGQRSYAQVMLSHHSGALSLVEGGWAYPDGLFRTSLDLSGDGGVIEWNSDAPPPLRVFEPPGAPELAALPALNPAQDPYAAELAHALHCLEYGLPFEVTPQDALAALRLSLAARESVRTGQAVTL